MNNMKCWDCALKHLACALSYGKEILSGHTKGSELDHRPDLIGEMSNCEHHVELLDPILFNVVSSLRKSLQAKKGFVTFEDLEEIRGLYLKVEELSEATGETEHKELQIRNARQYQAYQIDTSNRENILNLQPVVEYPAYTTALDIVYDNVDNIDFFQYSYDSIQKHLKNYGKIYVLKSSVDLSAFNIEIENKQLYDFCHDSKLSDDFILIKQNQALLKDFDVLHSYPAYSQRVDEKSSQVKEFLRNIGYTGAFYVYDNSKMQPVNKVRYINVMKDITCEYPLTCYFCLSGEKKLFNVQSSTVIIDRPVCCSTKNMLKTATFATWNNQKCFESMIEYLNK